MFDPFTVPAPVLDPAEAEAVGLLPVRPVTVRRVGRLTGLGASLLVVGFAAFAVLGWLSVGAHSAWAVAGAGLLASAGLVVGFGLLVRAVSVAEPSSAAYTVLEVTVGRAQRAGLIGSGTARAYRSAGQAVLDTEAGLVRDGHVPAALARSSAQGLEQLTAAVLAAAAHQSRQSR